MKDEGGPLDKSWIPVIVSGVLYLIGLGTLIRRVSVRRVQGRRVGTVTKLTAVAGGAATAYRELPSCSRYPCSPMASTFRELHSQLLLPAAFLLLLTATPLFLFMLLFPMWEPSAHLLTSQSIPRLVRGAIIAPWLLQTSPVRACR